MLGKIESKSSRGHQRMRWLDMVIDSMDMDVSKLWETVKNRGAWCVIVDEIAKNQMRLSD